MRTFTKEQLAELLAKHRAWLNNEDGGERADLSSADLRYADLSYADLSYADLSSADLSYADLRSANLRHADLSYADLRYADLRHADLRSADLSSTNLSYANLRHADLRHANLRFLQSANGKELACMFQSTRPGRSATNNGFLRVHHRPVSIHAPRAERDSVLLAR